jgi:hypothetical protein
VVAQEDVQLRQAQERLKAAGFDPGAVNGRLGPRTKTALRQYQAAYGLPVTGALDAATRKALLPEQAQPPEPVLPSSASHGTLPEAVAPLHTIAGPQLAPISTPERLPSPEEREKPRQGEELESSLEDSHYLAKIQQKVSAIFQSILSVFSKETVSERVQEKLPSLIIFTAVACTMLIPIGVIFFLCYFIKFFGNNYGKIGRLVYITSGVLMLFFSLREIDHFSQYNNYTKYIDDIVQNIFNIYKYITIYVVEEHNHRDMYESIPSIIEKLVVFGNMIGGVYLIFSYVEFLLNKRYGARTMATPKGARKRMWTFSIVTTVALGAVAATFPNLFISLIIHLVQHIVSDKAALPGFISWYIDLWWPATAGELLGLSASALFIMVLSLILTALGAKWLDYSGEMTTSGPMPTPWLSLGPLLVGIIGISLSLAGMLRFLYFLVYFILSTFTKVQ